MCLYIYTYPQCVVSCYICLGWLYNACLAQFRPSLVHTMSLAPHTYINVSIYVHVHALLCIYILVYTCDLKTEMYQCVQILLYFKMYTCSLLLHVYSIQPVYNSCSCYIIIMTNIINYLQSCRLLRNLQNIPLEGFLLLPVQKICKYPLQLSVSLDYHRNSTIL